MKIKMKNYIYQYANTLFAWDLDQSNNAFKFNQKFANFRDETNCSWSIILKMQRVGHIQSQTKFCKLLIEHQNNQSAADSSWMSGNLRIIFQ